MKLLTFVISAALCASGTLVAQTLEVAPARVLADEAAVIRATGLTPNQFNQNVAGAQ